MDHCCAANDELVSWEENHRVFNKHVSHPSLPAVTLLRTPTCLPWSFGPPYVLERGLKWGPALVQPCMLSPNWWMWDSCSPQSILWWILRPWPAHFPFAPSGPHLAPGHRPSTHTQPWSSWLGGGALPSGIRGLGHRETPQETLTKKVYYSLEIGMRRVCFSILCTCPNVQNMFLN